MKSWLRLGVVCAALGLGACGGLISNTKEVEIGTGVDREIETQFKIAAEDDPITGWARDLVEPLSQASAQFRDPQDFEGYKVEVIVDDALVNAFAAPGGYTYISTGLILRAKTCAEIAGVLGHELGHVTEKHGVRQLEGAIAGQMLADAVLKDGLAKDAATQIWAFLQSTQFSQAHETEADNVGVQIAHDAGYNPFGLADFFRALLALEKQSGGSPPRFLSSHPATSDRIAAVTSIIERKYGASVVPERTQTYACRGTRMTLEQARSHIESGRVKVKTGTGERTGAGGN